MSRMVRTLVSVIFVAASLAACGYSIDMAEHDYAIHYNGVSAGTGTSTHQDSGWWDGGAFSRMAPPTVDGSGPSGTLPELPRPSQSRARAEPVHASPLAGAPQLPT